MIIEYAHMQNANKTAASLHLKTSCNSCKVLKPINGGWGRTRAFVRGNKIRQ